MAQKTITVDDIDGSEGAKPVQLVHPESGQRYTIDLGPKNRANLLKALDPYLKAARSQGGRQGVRDKRGRMQRQYDRKGFRAWAEAHGKWEGKRPTNAMIDEYEESLR